MTKNKRFLITTALEESWRYNEPVLFLGEWCRLYSRKELWANMDAEVLPYHWANKSKFDRDSKFLSAYYEEKLYLLAKKLNEIHGIERSIRYWRILVGPWLAYFIQMLFDRWESINIAINQYDLSGTIVLEIDNDSCIPCDMMDFRDLFIDDVWNHLIFSKIINQHSNVDCISPNEIIIKQRRNLFEKPVQKNSSKKLVKTALSNLGIFLKRDTDVFLINTSLPVWIELLLQIRLIQFPQFSSENIKPIRVQPDHSKREWTLDKTNDSAFDVFVNDLISKQIPTVFLEGFKETIEQLTRLGWPQKPKAIVTSNSLWYDCISMAYTAEKVEKGSLLVHGQHGGFYGSGLFAWAEKHEIEICDYYLSWGWSEPMKRKVIPVGILTTIGKNKVKTFLTLKKKKEYILLVLDSLPRYSYRLGSDAKSGELVNCFEEHYSFVRNLPEVLQNQLLVRLYRSEYGWYMKSRWKDRFPSISLDDGKSNIQSLLIKSNICVYTYNSTGYLETLSLNIPTIIFWNINFNPLRESAKPFFAKLKMAGIFHETPESAAHKVAEVWNDVYGWWNQPEIQEAREYFCDQFARTVNYPTRILKNIIQSTE